MNFNFVVTRQYLLKSHIPHFRHVVQKDTRIIITILSQQIEQINSIEHKKLVA